MFFSWPHVRECKKFFIEEKTGKLCLWNPEDNLRNPESHQRLQSRIQVPLTKTAGSPVLRILNTLIPLHRAIHLHLPVKAVNPHFRFNIMISVSIHV